jgi:3-isopropylmalate dehydrogenase
MATILSGSMMLNWLGERNDDKAAIGAGQLIESAVAQVIKERNMLTPDLGGKAGTKEVGDAVLDAIESGRFSQE